MNDGDEQTDARPHTVGRTPNWGYLLRELQEIHRVSSAGGSARVRAHHDRVRGLLGELIEQDAPYAPARQGPEPEAVAHLTRAIDRGVRQPSQEVIRAVRALRGELAWHTEYDELPAPMRGRFAQCEIAGPHGPVRSPDVIVGLMLFAPGCRYPAHWHEQIDESYLVLSGSMSENDGGVWAPGSLILNPAESVHRINLGGSEPGMVAYAWLGERETLANPVTRFVAGAG